ncbi:hypothetical protein DWF04_005985 [Cereibacter sphaeroides f. sp. denitrificans]|nr:hypothetical protein DWF04_06215 [Cereibacter sphaeroides f. sp. denitrificans]
MPDAVSIIRAALARWPSRRGLAAEIGVDLHVVHKMHGRGHIPEKHHAAILASAARLGIRIAPEELHGRPAPERVGKRKRKARSA